jgi:hypothetical protein
MNNVLCPKCRMAQPLDLLASGVPFSCPSCRASLQVSVFPAIHRDIGPGAHAERAILDGEATCFFHAEKKAAAVCDECGRFLCALCDVAIGARHLCPKCIEAGRQKQTLTTFESYRVSYPSLAFLTAFVPFVLYPLTFLTFITAPCAIFLVIYGWRKPPSLTGRRRRATMIFALFFALAQCAGWIALSIFLYQTLLRG